MSTPAGLYSDADAAGGPVGGKMRRRPMRRAPATPYDRPPPPPAAPAAPAGGGWLSKLVDPASRLITVGASRIFRTFFGRGPAAALLPPPPSSAPGALALLSPNCVSSMVVWSCCSLFVWAAVGILPCCRLGGREFLTCG